MNPKKIILCPNPSRDRGMNATKRVDKMLREMGCELGQGYYFSRPLPMNVFFEKFCRKVIDKS